MKVYVIALTALLVFTGSFLFKVDFNTYTQYVEELKSTANDAADAAALYYDLDLFADGFKVFNKTESEKAILYIIRTNLNLNEQLCSSNYIAPNKVHYTSYYFDQIGKLFIYKDGVLQSEKEISFPYLMVEAKTGYTKQIEEPMVVVTIDAGQADFMVRFIQEPLLIRTSGYEYIGG